MEGRATSQQPGARVGGAPEPSGACAQEAGAVLRVGLLGRGSIGGPVIRALQAGEVPGAVLAGVVTSTGAAPTPPDGEVPICSLEDLIDRADVIVEAAGQKPLAVHGPAIIAAGVDLLVLSVGALVDAELRRTLRSGPGCLLICSGAIGGLDLLRAVAVNGGLHQVTMTSTKLPGTLIQDWMDGETVDLLRSATKPMVVLRGSPLEVARAFPKSANVAAAVGLAASSWDVVEVVMKADPAATVTRHVIEIDSDSGRYRFDIAHRPHPDNPATAAVVPLAVLRSLGDLAGRPEVLM